MAERRMFSKTVIGSDAFLDLPKEAQLLYFHLAMVADDDGFVNSPTKIRRMLNVTPEDYQCLIDKEWILPFDSGVVAIRHWKRHNYIQKDRYTPTTYKNERCTLSIDENGMYTTCIQSVYKLYTQDRLGKDSIGKDSIGKDSIDKDRLVESSIEEFPAPAATTTYEEIKKENPTDSSLANTADSNPLSAGEISQREETQPHSVGEISQREETQPHFVGEISQMEETKPLTSGVVARSDGEGKTETGLRAWKIRLECSVPAIIKLTDEECVTMYERLGREKFTWYTWKLATFIKDRRAYVKSHCDTIMRWYFEDMESFGQIDAMESYGHGGEMQSYGHGGEMQSYGHGGEMQNHGQNGAMESYGRINTFENAAKNGAEMSAVQSFGQNGGAENGVQMSAVGGSEVENFMPRENGQINACRGAEASYPYGNINEAEMPRKTAVFALRREVNLNGVNQAGDQWKNQDFYPKDNFQKNRVENESANSDISSTVSPPESERFSSGKNADKSEVAKPEIFGTAPQIRSDFYTPAPQQSSYNSPPPNPYPTPQQSSYNSSPPNPYPTPQQNPYSPPPQNPYNAQPQNPYNAQPQNPYNAQPQNPYNAQSQNPSAYVPVPPKNPYAAPQQNPVAYSPTPPPNPYARSPYKREPHGVGKPHGQAYGQSQKIERVRYGNFDVKQAFNEALARPLPDDWETIDE